MKSTPPQTPPQADSNAIDNTVQEIRLHKSRARFVGWIMFFIFLALIGVTILALWFLVVKEQGTPNIEKETKQLIEEAKKETGL